MTKEVFTIPEADVKNLTEVIKEHIRTTKAKVPPQDAFCKIWPQARGSITASQYFHCDYPRGWDFRQGCRRHCDRRG